MLSHWKNWIADRLGHRAPKRRLAAPRFRGQLESLESRNVLSATIGVVSFDVVAVRVEPTSVTVVAVAEFQPLTNDASPLDPIRAFVDGRRDSYGSLPPRTWFFGPPTLGRGDHWSLNSLQNKFDVGVTGYGGTGGGTVFMPETGNIGNGPTGDVDPPLMAGADDSAGDTTNTTTNHRGALALSGANGPAGAAERPFRLHVNFAAGNLTLTAPEYSSESSTSPKPLSTENFDAAFEELSSDSLLLATDAEWEGGSKLFGDDDELDILNDKDRQEIELADSSFNDHLAESLDALERERAAVDAVLAALHEIDLTEPENSTGDAGQSHCDPANSQAREVAERFFIAGYTESSQTSNDASAGGMVLLAATGDANGSAYELATATGDADHGMISLAVEAPVGLYQAVDVGVRPEPTITAQNASTLEPAAKVQTSASAENAPAKKSEQPS